jgi:hypothetical protein
MRHAGEVLTDADAEVQAAFERKPSIQSFIKNPSGAMGDPDWWLDSFGSAVGSGAPMLLAGGLASKVAPAVGAGLTEGAIVFGQTYNDARAKGADPDTAREAASIVAAGTTATQIPANQFGIFSEKVRSVGRRLLTGGAAESGQEGLQTWWENVVAGAFYDKDRPKFEGVPEAMVGSALFGAAAGSAGIAEREQGATMRPGRRRASRAMVDRPAGRSFERLTRESIEAEPVLNEPVVPPRDLPEALPKSAEDAASALASQQDAVDQIIEAAPPMSEKRLSTDMAKEGIPHPSAAYEQEQYPAASEERPAPTEQPQPASKADESPAAPEPRGEVVQQPVQTYARESEPDGAQKADPVSEGPRQDPDIFRVPTNELYLDPVRFQYKVEGIGQGGVNEELKGSKKWDAGLAGVISVWKDPSNGKTYVVNGHHRYDLARRLNVPDLTVRFIDAPNAESARARGALQNIAEGRGTSVDAAKFMRDSGMTAAEIEGEGVSLKGMVAREGSALSNLTSALFDDVVHGQLPVKRAVIIGEMLPDHTDQSAAVQMLRAAEQRGKRLTDQEVRELFRRITGAERRVESQDTLFGVEEMTQNLALEEAQLSNAIRQRLGQEKKLFGLVGTKSNADRLGAAGNKIEADANKAIADQAEQVLAVYDKLSLSAGPISDALRAGARRLADGEKLDAVKDAVYVSVRDSVAKLLGGKKTGIREADAGGKESGPRWAEEGSRERDAQVRAANTVEQTPDGPQETLATDRQARESQIAAKNDLTTPLVDVPFSLRPDDPQSPDAPAGPAERQSSMFGDSEGGEQVASYAPYQPTEEDEFRLGQRTGTMVSRRDIIADLQKRLNGIPIRTGGMRGKARGIFKVRQGVIRTKRAEDIYAVAHEAGHAIHKLLWGTDASGSNLNSGPLQAFAAELGALDYDPKQKRSFEGFAEYIRLRLMSETDAQRKAPRFHAWFENRLNTAPDVKEAIRISKQKYDQWSAQPAEAKVASAINTRPEEKSNWEKFSAAMARMYDDLVDDRAQIARAEKDLAEAGAPVEIVASASKMAQLSSGWSQAAMVFLEDSTYNAATFTKNGKSFRAIVKPLAARKQSDRNPRFNWLAKEWGIARENDGLDDFRIYLVARRMNDYFDKSLETGFGITEIREAITATETPELEAAARELHEYQDRVLEFMVARGALSQEAKDAINRRNSFYVPMYRIMDDAGSSDVHAGGRSLIDLNSPIRKRVGSAREITDPLESIVKNTYSMMSFTFRNAAGQALVKQAARAQDKGSILESGIAPGLKVTRFNIQEVAKPIKEAIKDAGLDPADVDLDIQAAIYRPNRDPKRANGEVAITVDGERRIYVMDSALITAMEVVPHEARHLLMRILAAPAKLLKFGATGAGPEFIFRNPLRDTETAFMQSKNGFLPIVDTIMGAYEMLRNPDTIREMRVAGGGSAGFMPVDRRALRRHVDELLLNKPQYVIRHPMEVFHILGEAMKAAGEFTEQATRVGEYRLARKKGKSPQEAAIDARDVSLDFDRQGALARPFNAITPFFSASINGTTRFIETHTKNPVRTFMRGVVGTTIPTILLWMLNKDDDDYKEAEAWKKNLFWLFPTKYLPEPIGKVFGPFIMIPRAHLYGLVYGNSVERMLEAWYQKNQDAFDGFGTDLYQAATPPVGLAAIKPIFEAIANYSFFTGNPIEDRSMESLSPQYRSRPATSETAKAIAKTMSSIGVVDWSPAKWEHVLYGYTAGLGRAVVATAEKVAGLRDKRPALEAADIPVVRAFATPTAPRQAASVTKFYEKLDKLRKAKADYGDRLKHPNGPSANAPPMLPDDRRSLAKLEEFADQISSVSRQMKSIEYGSLSPSQKRDKLIELQKNKIDTARRALGRPPMYTISR